MDLNNSIKVNGKIISVKAFYLDVRKQSHLHKGSIKLKIVTDYDVQCLKDSIINQTSLDITIPFGNKDLSSSFVCQRSCRNEDFSKMRPSGYRVMLYEYILLSVGSFTKKGARNHETN